MSSHPVVLPPRTESELVLDLTAGRMEIGGSSADLRSSQVDAVLEEYVSLLHTLRGIERGQKLTLRDSDLAVLSHVLERNLTILEQRLVELMVAPDLRGVEAAEDGATWARVPSFITLRRAGLTAAALLAIGGAAFAAVQLSTPTRAETQALPQPVAAVITESVITESIVPNIGEPARIFAPAETADELDVGDVVLQVDTRDLIVPQSEPLSISEVELAAASIGISIVASAVPAPATPAPATPVPAAPAAVPPVPAAPVPAAPVPAEAGGSFAQLGSEAESVIGYNFRGALPGWQFFYEGDSPSYRGLTNTEVRTITIYTNPGESAWSVAGVLAHEVGHAIDVSHLNATQRQQWIDARGLPQQWWPGSGLSDFHVGAGDLAEAIAAYLTGSPSESAYGGFTADQLQLAASFLP